MSDEYVLGYAAAERAVETLAGGDRNRCWGTMVYACRNRGDGYDLPPCGHEERYALGVGVEGPPAMRREFVDAIEQVRDRVGFDDFARVLAEIDLPGYIPAPFGAGTCPNCHGGVMVHTRFADDERWTAIAYAEAGQRFFRVPDPYKAAALAADGYGGAELVLGVP